jgi:lipid II:glycine glycyltransferase (peptidoglycan interpeptide bridge formation enzyme)
MRVVELSFKDMEQWNAIVSSFDFSHPLNAYGWGSVREIDGWKPAYFIVESDNGGNISGAMMILMKKIPWTGLSIVYAPRAPVCDPHDHETIKLLTRHFRQLARKSRAVFLRIDPGFHEEVYCGSQDPFVGEGFIHLAQRWSFWNSPRDVYRIDLNKVDTVDALFGTIDRDARRCVRKAEKEGVTIRAAQTLDELKSFYQVFSQFTVGKGFMCRQYRYQEALWTEFVSRGDGRLFLATYKDQIIGGLLCLSFGGKCLAMHMGTPSRFNKLHTYYAYVWESIRWAKEKGCRWYSFRGVGTTPSQESFKKKFGPEVVPLIGYYDLPFRPFLYKLFCMVEFWVLPNVWRTLMHIRRIAKSMKNIKKKISSVDE